jgi:OmcA/MtrC family decaheme c-type cytochrome
MNAPSQASSSLRAALLGALLAGCTGATGSSVLVATSAEPAGAHCATGGVKIDVGVDVNGNGTLDPAEVNAAQTRYVCNGANSATLVKTSPELAGSHCPFGGVRIDSGVDANGDGVLEPAEVDPARTAYACNGGSGPASTSSGLAIAVQSVSTDPAAPIAVHFTLRDSRGFPVDKAGIYTVNTPMALRFSLSTIEKDVDGNVLPYRVMTQASSATAPTVFQPTAYAPPQGTLVEDTPLSGAYTYTFPAADVTQNGAIARAVAYDKSKLMATHTLWIQASRQTNLMNTTDPAGFTALNVEYNFIPGDPNGKPDRREIASTAGCNNCHRGFTAEGTTASSFHGSGRIDAGFCDVCHNPGHVSNPSALSSVFVHRIHAGEQLQPQNVFHGIAATYPQDLRNCNACHKGAAQGAQAQGHPTLAACTSCHDQVDFAAASGLAACVHPPALDAQTGLPQPCKHTGGAAADGACATCHTPALIDSYHQSVAPPDPNNLLAGGTNPNTNAAYLASAGFVPPGASVVSYAIQSVDVVPDAGGVKRLSIAFKLQRDGADVVFPTPGPGATEIIDGFVGSPSVYFAFAVPQDGIAAPAEYNVTASGYLRTIWNGTATGAGAGKLSGPDDKGFYTVVLTNVVVPDNATMVTGGVGYTYSLASTIPLTQVNLPAYPYTPVNKQGGLIVPAADVYKVATSYTGRHVVIDNNQCLKCHVALGAAPTFHAGQRNNGPTCSFCHNPNRTSSGWAANAKDFIHAIHGARKRTVDFNWHAAAPGDSFADVEFPGPLNNCTACHVAADYDFSSAASAAAVPNMLVSTAATGKLDANPQTNPNGWFSISPYVVADGVTDYGLGFSTSKEATRTCSTSAPCQADPTTLVKSPLTAACSACHDSPLAVDHMETMGGSFYKPRGEVLAPGAKQEECLLCHGPGKIAAIADVHR